MTALYPPGRASAPLPDDYRVQHPQPHHLLAEIERASAELMWALHKHRSAWAKMAKLKAEAEQRGNAWFMDNQRDWKIATGDVAWWRGEVSARSNSLQAMLALAGAFGLSLPRPPGYTAGQARVY